MTNSLEARGLPRPGYAEEWIAGQSVSNWRDALVGAVTVTIAAEICSFFAVGMILRFHVVVH
jgi:hypothetical protein